MPDEGKTPSTKKDLQGLKKDFQELRKMTQKDLLEFKEEIIHHFDVVIETIRHDLLGANKDEIEGLKHRITRLELHTKLKP